MCIRDSCTDTWYGVPLYLFLEFVPITVFYLVILIFQISVTTAPMTCYVVYSQLIVYIFIRYSKPYLSLESRSAYTIFHTLLMLHGIWNLDFFRYIVPPFCVSPNLRNVYVVFLGYVSAVYPLLLIALTWVCIRLHSHDYKPLVWLWNKLSCFKIKQDSRSTIIDVFATFFFLSYTKLSLTSMSILQYTIVYQANSSHTHHVLYTDPSVHHFKNEHIPFATFAILVLLVSGLLALLLAVYPIAIFRALILKCITGGHSRATLNIFVEKFYSCYRDGLDGGRDMRSFVSLYLFLRMLSFILFSLIYQTILFGVCCLVIALVRPYKKTYMNNIETAILALLTLVTYLFNNYNMFFDSNYAKLYLWSTAVAAYLPLLIVLFSIFSSKQLFTKIKRKLSIRYKIFRSIIHLSQESESGGHDPHRMVHPDQYNIRKASNGTSESDALLHGPEYVSIE